MEQITKFIQGDLGIQFLKIGIAILVILVLATIVKKIVPKYVKNTNSRYKTRKFISFLTYLLIIVSVLIVFSNKLSGITVFLGVAGAGIAFALQEVIASIAGFVAIHFSNFYKVGSC